MVRAFRDVVRAVTNGFPGAAEPPAEAVTQWQEELERGLRRLENLQRLVTNPPERKPGSRRGWGSTSGTSRDSTGTVEATHRTAAVRPTSGSRPYIFDSCGRSFVEHMTRRDSILHLDWGVFGRRTRPHGRRLRDPDPARWRAGVEFVGPGSALGLGYCMARRCAALVARIPKCR